MLSAYAMQHRQAASHLVRIGRSFALMASAALHRARPYATRAKPGKKPQTEATETKSKAAPKAEKAKLSKENTVKAAKPPKEVRKKSKSKDRKTTLEIGTTFEWRSLHFLKEYFSMDLSRVAGRGDGGVDLAGWWWLPQLRHTPGTVKGIQKDEGILSERFRIRVLAQCKAERTRMGPNYVREMEGVLHRLMHSSTASGIEKFVTEASPTLPEPEEGPHLARPIPTLAMLISQSRFSRGAIERAMSSPIPFLLLHLPPEKPSQSTKGAEDPKADDGEDVPSLQWNAALGSEKGLLHGQMDIRWEHSDEGPQPTLWWQGRPLENCVPASPSLSS